MNRKEGWRKEAGENVSQNERKVRKLFRFPGQSKLAVCLALALITVSHADLREKEGGGHPDPEIRWAGGHSPKKFFSALRASVWSKNKGGGVGGRGPPGPSPGACFSKVPVTLRARNQIFKSKC